ncbi:quinoprotein relay system zinc metallohydrolase 2 [Ancylobacter dichloromethanicus]|uniref:MBL fold metallo-hydrolase n=1 Tax=Ancylobacter dichloromethanicus TaxID=518825 RepID=A0A9W6N0E4_9HYPH|nr:quinoprotein relay system zinc metallohydrolase 2 [Ancylobacter dichloromethanicus]MBS7555203.1 quinoprotein relay system zinc metallohydrolase 2 [Ancylobacter dichloromethanicus]GLK73704.1 MBL fold metallo-hydrolase [Ancylobacter dichloromethanicus]
MALPRLDRRGLLVLGTLIAAGRVPLARAGNGNYRDDRLPLEAIAEGVHVFRAPYELIAPSNDGAIANMTLIVGDEAAAIIDTGNSLLAGARMRAAMRAVTDKPLRYVINTHMHPDHTLGNAAFAGDAPRFVAHHKMPRALSLRAETYLAQAERMLGAQAEGTRIVLPDLLVEDRLTLDLGGRPLELRAHPTAHTDNDLTVFDVVSGTWVMGDLLFVGHIPTLDGSLLGWLALLDQLTGTPAARAVPGHGPSSVAWPQASAPERRYLDVLRSDIRQLLAEGGAMSEAPAHAVVSERGDWVLFDEFNARNAIAAYHELEWE